MFLPANPVKAKVKRIAFALALAFCAVTPTLAADEWECRALQLQIDNAPLSSGSGKNSGQAARYAKAISAQEVQIGKAKSQLRALGCSGSIITLGGGSKPSCGKVNAALKSMNANMSKLKAQYSRLSGGGGGTVSSREVLRARYNAAGCGGSQPIKVKAKKEENNIAAILGDTKASRDEQRKAALKSEVPGLDFGGDTFRTLCVRKCDGYYFPISFSTTRENFKRDTVACESMCPGTEVELFMHKVPEEESEDMVSKKGEPYKAMSYAFAYRKEGVAGDPSCRCLAVQGMATLNNGEAGQSGIASIDGKAIEQSSEVEAANMVPVPMPRADSLADMMFDREAVADAAGKLTDEDIIAIFEPQIAETNSDGSVRLVGPVFLPDASEAIDLKVPLRPLVR